MYNYNMSYQWPNQSYMAKIQQVEVKGLIPTLAIKANSLVGHIFWRWLGFSVNIYLFESKVWVFCLTTSGQAYVMFWQISPAFVQIL